MIRFFFVFGKIWINSLSHSNYVVFFRWNGTCTLDSLFLVLNRFIAEFIYIFSCINYVWLPGEGSRANLVCISELEIWSIPLCFKYTT